MGKSRKSKNLKKREITRKLLKYGYLTTNTLLEETKVTDTVVTWDVENYSELSHCVRYTADSVECNRFWKMFLFRYPPFLFIYLKTDDFVSDIIFLIRTGNGRIMDQSFGNETRKVPKVYYVRFEEQRIFAPSKNLFDDTLLIQCIYTARPHENTLFLTPKMKECSGLKTSDVDVLFTDLKNLYLSAKFYDFIFEAGYAEFKVHKLILFRHSKFLARKMKEDPDWSGDRFGLRIDPAVMHQVFLYLYSGELINLEVTDMFEVYRIACELEIGSLQEICLHFFKSSLSIYNALSFLILAKICDKADLKKEIVLFLNNQPESVRKSKIWANVIEEVIKYVPEDIHGLNET